MMLVVSATAIVAWAQQATTPAASPAPVAQAAPATPGAQAGTPPALKIDSGDTAWVLTSSALVLLMTAPGLALFYGGVGPRQHARAAPLQYLLHLAALSLHR